MEMSNAKKRIIVALDTDSPQKALEIARPLINEVGLFKVGMELFPRGGPQLIEEIHKMGGETFIDLKFNDIPNTVNGAVRSMVALGARFTTVHASGGKAMLQAATQASNGSGLTILAVTVLTSLDNADLNQIGFSEELNSAELALRLAQLAKSAGISGIVCSAKEVALIRKLIGNNTTLVTPGIRFPEGDIGDQKRVVTPDAAICLGADYIVVGRPITKAPDPVAAARRFAEAIEKGLAERSDDGNNHHISTPIITLGDKALPEYKQDDPYVAKDIAAGNISLKPKHDWPRLRAAMENIVK